MEKLAVIAAFLACTACAGDELTNTSMLTTWISNEGYSIVLAEDQTYRFCDKAQCFVGPFERPGSTDGIAVVLKDFFTHPESRRLHARLKELTEPAGPFDALYPDFDFTVNSGVGPLPSSELCDNKPCVIFGNHDLPDVILFIRQDDLK